MTRSFIEDGYIYINKRSDSDYVLARNQDGSDSYDLPQNYEDTEYSFDEAEQYYIDNPDKRFEFPVRQKTEEELIQEELETLHAFLNETDKYVVKCYDRELNFKTEYPELYEQRQQARDRINELEETESEETEPEQPKTSDTDLNV